MARAHAEAPPKRPPRTEDSVSSGLKLSLFAHFAVAALILLKSTVFPGDPMPIVPVLRVDMVGLPDVLKKDLSNLAKQPPADSKIAEALKQAEEAAKQVKPPPPVPKTQPVEEAAPDEMVLKPKDQPKPKTMEKPHPTKEVAKDSTRDKKLKSALDRIKALDKITESTGAPSRDNVAKSGTIIKGNQISRGTSLSGDAKEAAQASYYDLIRDRLQENWALPVWLARQKLSAQVMLMIDSRGMVRGMKFTKPSGNAQFDESVKRTIAASQPFPTPPAELAGSIVSNGILVGFPL